MCRVALVYNIFLFFVVCCFLDCAFMVTFLSSILSKCAKIIIEYLGVPSSSALCEHQKDEPNTEWPQLEAPQMTPSALESPAYQNVCV